MLIINERDTSCNNVNFMVIWAGTSFCKQNCCVLSNFSCLGAYQTTDFMKLGLAGEGGWIGREIDCDGVRA